MKMSQTFVYLPDKFKQLPSYEIGSFAVKLSNLEKDGIPVTKSAVIPINTLKIIAQANNLQAQVYKIIQETDYSSSNSRDSACKKLEHIITKQMIPNELAKSFMDTYHNYFKKSFILIRNSENLPFQKIEVSNIHGDTNFVDATLEVWAQMSCLKLKKLKANIHNIHDVMFPSPILIQEQLESKVSGIAYSYDLEDGSKNRVTILSTWGVYHPDQKDVDTHLVDIRTKNVIFQKKKHKRNQYRRVLGKLRIDEVLEKYKHHDTIHNQDLKTLADLVSKIKKKYLSQIEVLWGIQGDRIYVENVKESDFYKKKNHKEKSIFKLYSTVHSSENLTKRSENWDGLVVYDSGQLLSVSATHPNEVVKTKQKDLLTEAISRILVKYVEKSGKPLIYRANNFTSNEFNQLQFASIYEVPERNPYLGFRGGLRYLSQQKAFRIELEALEKTLKKVKEEVILVLPFVRSADELAQLLSVINKNGLNKFDNFSVWLELSTPENILNLSEYPLKQIQGVVFNTQSVNALLTGVDPNNPDIHTHYSLNVTLIKTLVEQMIKSVKQQTRTKSIELQPQIFIDLTNYNKELLEELCDLEINGFITNEQVTELAKKCIINTQHNKVL